VRTLARLLTADGLMTEESLATLKAEVDAEVNRAADEALAAELPAPESAYEFVYSPDVDPTSNAFATAPAAGSGEPTTMVDLINACLRDEINPGPRRVCFGDAVRSGT